MAKPTPPVYCSFCRRSSDVVDKLVGGPGVHICDVCVGLCVAVLDADAAATAKSPKKKGKAAERPAPSPPPPPFGGWASLDDDTLLKSLVPAGSCLQSLDDSIRDQVSALRERGVTWQLIADELGVTRQAVQQRFGG